MKYYYTDLPVDYSGNWLLMLAFVAPTMLCFRLWYESMRSNTDEIVRKVIESIAAVTPTQPPSLPQMNINDVESNIPADDESDDADNDDDNPCKVDIDMSVDSLGKIKYLTIISGREYIAVYICLIIAFTVYDTIIYNNASGGPWGYWIYFPIPIQIIVSASLSTILAILIAFRFFVAYKNKAVNEEYCLKHWEECAAIPFLSVLTNYILVHVFWISILFVSFPALVALEGIFLIPLSIPVIVVLQRMFSCFKIICCKLRCPKSPKSCEDFGTYIGAAHFFTLIWIPLLILLHYIPKYLLDASEISNDPLKLITIVLGAIFITYRTAKIWGDEFYFKRSQMRHVGTRERENTPISTNNNNYNSV